MTWTPPTLAAVTTYQGGVPCDVCPRTDPPDMLVDTALLAAPLRAQLRLGPADRYVCHACVGKWVLPGAGVLTRAQLALALGADHDAIIAHAWEDFCFERERRGRNGYNNLSAPDWEAFRAACLAAPALSGVGALPLALAMPTATVRDQVWAAFTAARLVGGALLGPTDQAAFAAVWAAVRP